MHADYKVAIIGCGKVGHTHAKAYGRRACLPLVAGVDVNGENLEKFCNAFSITGRFSSVSDMLAEIQPDIVSIATYADSHLSLLERCVEAGVRGIVCEKPLLNSPSEIPRLHQLLKGCETKIVVHHMRRYGLANTRARALIDEGAIGDLSMMVGMVENMDLGEMGTHWIDLFRFFNADKPIRSVFAQAEVADARCNGHAVEDFSVAWFEFQNGCRGVINCNSGGPLTGGVYTQLLGTQGAIQIEGEDVLVVSTADGTQRESFKQVLPVPWQSLGVDEPEPWWDYKSDLLLEDLLCWMDGGEASGVSLPAQLETAEAYLGAYLSAIRGERVSLPLDAEDFEMDVWPVEVLARTRKKP